MLEGDELFENSNETPYKICSVVATNDPGYVPWNRVFSAQWDPNDSDRIVLCSQNGQIRVVHRSSNVEKTFNVKFRRFLATTVDHNTDGKIVSYHFDKICLIPKKPGEFLFLLGVSRSIMYSALPGYSNGSLSQSCRPNSSSFAHGCSVFELYSHTSRVTAIAVSPTGNLMVSVVHIAIPYRDQTHPKLILPNRLLATNWEM